MSDAPVLEESVPLQEFCAELSATDKQVELIACFYSREKAAGRWHDTSANYKTRYALTAATPAP